jgi:hypothetical protein
LGWKALIIIRDQKGVKRAVRAPTDRHVGEVMPRCRISVNVPEEDRDKYVTSAGRLNVAVSSFAGLLMAVGYEQIMNNPELLMKVIRNEP